MSGRGALTEAVSWNTPAASARTSIVTGTVAPFAVGAAVHVTVCPAAAQPGAPDTKLTHPAGRSSPSG